MTFAYVANLTSLGTLARQIPDFTVFSDSLNHGSMTKGIQRARAHKELWRDNDVVHLDALLTEAGPFCSKLIAFEFTS